ncbi:MULTISPECIES: GNAT family N-acetyltransferase [unclassified Leucobacter]|uniref:GNAT family N-acetyltransferase n=1 Tax=unclassified Leucobacter TaxID=2621730 RepID=UPI0006225BB7|nr:GNAT family N-acetyltransferase [Leucobacter sp. Ag1]KKI21025.1 hypothetical protein XM48_06480 [Leucobacter sp. Ag1]
MSLMVDRWAEGWAACRAKPLERDGDAWLVRVGDEHRDLEFVVEDPSPAEAARLAALASGPRRWLTVLGDPEPAAATALAGLPTVSQVETMMTVRLTAEPHDGDAILAEDGDVVRASFEIDGVEAARGIAALAAGSVVLDRISTDERFRRRGLGRRVVAALTGWAMDRGADTGVLIASPAGRRLYLELGWSDLLPVASYAGPAEPAASRAESRSSSTAQLRST